VVSQYHDIKRAKIRRIDNEKHRQGTELQSWVTLLRSSLKNDNGTL
jgi:hypothetical protein